MVGKKPTQGYTVWCHFERRRAEYLDYISETIGRWSTSCDSERCQTPEDRGNVPVGGSRN